MFVGECDVCQSGVQIGDQVVYKLCFSTRADPQAKEVDICRRAAIPFTVHHRRRPHLQVYSDSFANGITVFSELICTQNDMGLYNLLQNECARIARPRLGNTHRGVRNPNVPGVGLICSRIQDMFGITAANVVVSCYADASSTRPWHQDKFRSNEELAIICSFGGERQLLFKHLCTGSVVPIKQLNGTVTIFGRTLNSECVHGIMSEHGAAPRLSVTIWGKRR